MKKYSIVVRDPIAGGEYKIRAIPDNTSLTVCTGYFYNYLASDVEDTVTWYNIVHGLFGWMFKQLSLYRETGKFADYLSYLPFLELTTTHDFKKWWYNRDGELVQLEVLKVTLLED